MGWEAIRRDGDPDVVKAISLWFDVIPDVTLPDYMKLLGERARLLRAWGLFFEKYPLVVGPVSTEPPFEIGFDVKDAEATRKLLAAQRLLVAINMMGLPATAVPVGRAQNGLPLGVQVIGGRYQEMLTLDGAEAIEARCGVKTPIDPAW
jgi:amidase